MRLKHKFASAGLGAALMLGAPGLQADDTDIYFQTGGSTGGVPLVMFYLQYTSELNSTVCSGVTDQLRTTLLNAGCSDLYILSGYFADQDFSDSTITRFEVIRAVLKRVLAPLGNMKVGIMLSHDDNNKCTGPGDNTGCSNGAYILKGFTPLELPRPTFYPNYPNWDLVYYDADGNPTQKKAFFEALDGIPAPQGNLSHPHQNKEVYFELFRYLTGQGVYNAHNGWADFATVTDVNLGSTADISTTTPNGTASLVWDTSIESSGNYISPLTEHCSRVFVVNILKGKGNSADNSDSAISATLASAGMAFDVSNSDAGFAEMVRWLYDKDLADGSINGLDLEERQNVTSFFVADQPQQVDDAANAGGTGYALTLSDDATTLVRTIDSIFNQILSVSTTFVSASIPVNVFNRSEVLDNVYIALFQTDPDNKPQWAGDLKKLKLSIAVRNAGQVNEYKELVILDSLGQPAIAPDGRIRHDALTYWSIFNAWDINKLDDPNEIRSRDGRSVNRGGAGQKIPGFLGTDVWDPNSGVPTETNAGGGRQLFTDAGTDLIALNADMTTAEKLWPYLLGDASDWANADNPPTSTTTWTEAATLYWRMPDATIAGDTGVTLQQEALNVLKFVRGIDVKDTDNDGLTTDVRRWIFGDPLHARPLPISYGIPVSGYTEADPDIRIITGGNDGFVRMVRNITSSLAEDGREMWGFMPKQALAIQKKLMDNAAGTGHPYGADGAPTARILDVNQDGTINPADGDKVYVYFGMRRGGNGYYALDVSYPDDPQMLWSITNETPGFESLGLTFASPQIRTLDWGLGPKPVFIVGGGYDIDKDDLSVITSTYQDDQGAGIYIIDAETGDLVWKAVRGTTGPISSTEYNHAELDDSIPSDVTAVDTNADGNIDRFYVGDTGGRVWRGDLPGNDRTQWTVMELLSVGRHATPSSGEAVEDRRFFHAPDFVPSRQWDSVTNAYKNYDAIVVGSGDRAHPLSAPGAGGVWDWMYMFKDYHVNTGTPPSTVVQFDELDDVTANCLQNYNCTQIGTLEKGWRMTLTIPGEKALSAPLTYKGSIYFTSYIPKLSTASCGPSEGTGLAYHIALDDATAVYNYDTTNDISDLPGDTSNVNDPTNTELFVNCQAPPCDETGPGDRARIMKSGGIPSDPVFVRYGGIECIMNTDFVCQEDKKKAAWRTYWYLREE